MHALGEKNIYAHKRATLYPEHVIRITKVFLGEIKLDRMVGTIPVIPNDVQMTASTLYTKNLNNPYQSSVCVRVCVLCNPPYFIRGTAHLQVQVHDTEEE